MIFGSVCSGIEAASVAWEPLGWRGAWFSEIEPFPSAVLEHLWPKTPNLGDFTTIRERIASWEVPAPEVLVGGTPCQAFSVAGLRQSMGDSRGQLTLEFVRLANGIDAARSLLGIPECIVVWENVPGVLNTPDNAFGCFLAGLAGEDDPLIPPGGRWSNAGRVLGPSRAVAWRILDAQYFGVAQRRRRVFVVASAREGFSPDEVLFEFDGVRRDSPPSREPGQGFAAVAGTLAANGGGLNRPAGNANELDFCVPVAPTIPSRSSAGGGMGTDFDLDGGLVQVVGFNASEDGTGRGCGAVAVALRGREGGAAIEVGDDVGFPLRASQGGGDKPHVMQAMQVRRLTCKEAERLQGFPDFHTRIPWRGKPAEDCPDGPRYKALGNSMAVPVMRWIGRRIERALAKTDQPE